MIKTLQYENGLRAAIMPMHGIRSVAVGFWVGAGSRYESEDINGLSHFTEHMMFKGTDKLTPFDIANKFESYGANMNAFTSKECTCYYYKAMDEYAEKCFDLMSSIMYESTFPAEELDKERKVIVEEINMVEDSPEDICYDKLACANYGESGLGQTIIGSIDNVLRFTGDDIRAYMDKMYVPNNMFLAFAGNISEEVADKWIKTYVFPRFSTKIKPIECKKTVSQKRKFECRIKDFEQSNIGLSFASIPFGDELTSTQLALSVILGGGMSSRLFQSIREQKGLAYSVYTSPSNYRDVGTLNVSINYSEENTQKVLKAVKEEIDLIKRDGITADELLRTKVQLKSSLVFSNESVQSCMMSIGKQMVYGGPVLDTDRRIEDIDKLSVEDVNDFARRVLDYEKMNAAYVGKKTSVDVLNEF